jgi:hypothetical protein
MNSLKRILVVMAMAVVPACGSADLDMDEEAVTGETYDPTAGENKADGVGGAPTYTYYQVRPDYRRCMYPACGGRWVKRVNRSTTLCAGGTYASECYVATMDYGRLGLSERTLDGFKSQVESGRGLLRGYVTTTIINGNRWGKFVATEGWSMSSGATAPAGTFRRLQDNGIRCITYPCFSVHAARLNQSYHTNVSGVSLARSQAPADEQAKAEEALGTQPRGILGVGYLKSIPSAGPAGAGLVFDATQFYFYVGP